MEDTTDTRTLVRTHLDGHRLLAHVAQDGLAAQLLDAVAYLLRLELLQLEEAGASE